VLFICGFVFYKSVIAACCVMLFSAAGLKAYSRTLADRRKMELRIQFKDMLYSISSSVSSGRHLKEAIIDAEAPAALIHGGDSMIVREIRNMKRIMTETNCSEDVVFTDLAKRSKIREIADFTDVCITCKYTGGDLTAMIDKAVLLLGENIELQREKDVMLSQKKLESKILVVMPVALTALVNLCSADYLAVMYQTFLGRIIMTAAFLGTAGSYLWSSRMINAQVSEI
jgi:tight adherence protein B